MPDKKIVICTAGGVNDKTQPTKHPAILETLAEIIKDGLEKTAKNEPPQAQAVITKSINDALTMIQDENIGTIIFLTHHIHPAVKVMAQSHPNLVIILLSIDPCLEETNNLHIIPKRILTTEKIPMLLNIADPVDPALLSDFSE